jgi:hypothetical protein
MRTRLRRLGVLVAAGALAVGGYALAAQGVTPVCPDGLECQNGTADEGDLGYTDDFDLHSQNGTVEVHEEYGNIAIANTARSDSMSFDNPVGEDWHVIDTKVVAGGQCGPSVPFPDTCASPFPTGGSGDEACYLGNAGSMCEGPDILKGSDGCSYNPSGDTCVWDTKETNVASLFAPGPASYATVVISDDVGDRPDCWNWISWVVESGPTAAWAAGAGADSDGTGLVNASVGFIDIDGVPAGSAVVKAILWWEMRGTGPVPTMFVNGVPVAAELIGSVPSPCWPGSGMSHAFRADVTTQVTGNGTYVLSGFPFGTGLGNPPWIGPSTYPRTDGASMMVFYEPRRRAQHFLRYQLAQPELSGETVTLVDQFATREVRLQEAEWLWNPAAKARTGRPAESIQRGEEHLVCYGLPYIPTPDRFVDVRNQFVESTLRVGRPLTLCAPASKSLAPEPGPPPEDLDHYLCYDVRGEAPAFVSETLSVSDQFGERTVRIDRTRELCNPVEKRRAGREPELRIRPEEHFVCYRITTQTPPFGARDVFTDDQFFTQALRVSTLERLCVPSTKTDRPVGALAARHAPR